MNFDGYNSVPKNYSPNNMGELLPNREIETPPMEVYNAEGKLVGFTWKYGDTIRLTFYTEGTVELDDGTFMTAEDFLKNKTFKLVFYNHRYDVIFKTVANASVKTSFIITPEISTEIFKRGIYYCSLTLTEGTKSIVTVYEPAVGTFCVK